MQYHCGYALVRQVQTIQYNLLQHVRYDDAVAKVYQVILLTQVEPGIPKCTYISQ